MKNYTIGFLIFWLFGMAFFFVLGTILLLPQGQTDVGQLVGWALVGFPTLAVGFWSITGIIPHADHDMW